MQRLSLGLCLAFTTILCNCVNAQEPGLDHTMYRLPIPGGFAVTPDLVQLIVSQPESAELVYYDTITEKESRRVEMEFQPGTMAIRDASLFVTGKGSSVIYEINWKTGKIVKQFSIPGDGISNLAVHPKRPLIFASTTNLEVFIVDLASEKAHKTKATGDYLAVSPDGESLFTGMQPRSSNGVILIKETPDGDIHFIYDRWGIRSVLAKYRISGLELKLTSSQPNASVNGYRMHLSPDGKRLMMPGGGGWRPPADGGTGGGYFIAVFDTANLSSKLGQAPHGESAIYHPVLNVAAISGLGHNLLLCDGRSFKERQKVIFSKGGHGGGHLLAFVGKGTKIALYNGANPDTNNEGLHFFDIDLSKDERAQLTKSYGTLPKPVTMSSIEKPEQKPKPQTSPKPAPEKGASSRLDPRRAVTKIDGPPIPEAKPSKPDPEDLIPLPKGVIAMTGFNDAKGINANSKPNSPYPLGISNAQGGGAEKGWQTPWPNSPNTTFVKDVVGEGDGALHLSPTVNSGRLWNKPQSGRFKIETMVRSPQGGGVLCYVWDKNHNGTGPMWHVANGQFGVLNGDGRGGGEKITIGECTPDTWYKVTLTIDTAAKRWSMKIDDHQSDRQFGFRFKPTQFQGINFLAEGKQEIYLDAIRILSVDEKN